jgi:hypothetical protein
MGDLTIFAGIMGVTGAPSVWTHTPITDIILINIVAYSASFLARFAVSVSFFGN